MSQFYITNMLRLIIITQHNQMISFWSYQKYIHDYQYVYRYRALEGLYVYGGGGGHGGIGNIALMSYNNIMSLIWTFMVNGLTYDYRVNHAMFYGRNNNKHVRDSGKGNRVTCTAETCRLNKD